MAKTNVKVCGICWKEDDHELNVKDKNNITWIKCDSCGIWIHLSCSSRPSLDLSI